MDVIGGQLPQSAGNPIYPGTLVTGPLLAGSIFHTSGASPAGLGSSGPALANVGYAVMCQSESITQATNGGSAGVWTSTNLIIPAQSQILRMSLLVSTAWTGGAATLGIGIVGTAAFFTAAGAITANALGLVLTATPGTDATRVANWKNVGTTDAQIMITSTNTGSGAGVLFIEYLQGINL